MPPDDSKRIKMCRYCDGMIEWGAEVCPHCGKDLAVEKFDDLEFIPTDVSPGRNMPKGPPKIAQPVDPEPPPIAQPIAPKKRPPVVSPRRGGKRRPAARPKGPPVVKPVGPSKGPPVVKPVGPSKGPPVVRPVGPPRKPPVVKPVGPPKKPPVLKPVAPSSDLPPIVAPVGPPTLPPMEPPVAKPLNEPAAEPPLVAPMHEDTDLPPGVEPLEECPICGADTNTPDEKGATCRECGAAVCLACLMRANGIRAGQDTTKNRKDWVDFLSLGERTIRCPACGRPGV